MSELSGASFEDLVAEMISRLGEDPGREGLKKTPERVAKSLSFLTKGYRETAEGAVGDALFEEHHRNMVVVKVYARRLQVQERLTEQVAQALWETTSPQGVGVVIEACHLCMMMRGVQKQNSKTITSAMRGSFLEDHRTRDEFLRLTTNVHQPMS